MAELLNEEGKTKKYLKLADLPAYTCSFYLSNKVWDRVLTWDYFARKTVGDQWVRSVDSISANIAEGFGRYHKKDKVHFYHIASGSVMESLDWLEKSKCRKLINETVYKEFLEILLDLKKQINSLVRFTRERLDL